MLYRSSLTAPCERVLPTLVAGGPTVAVIGGRLTDLESRAREIMNMLEPFTVLIYQLINVSHFIMIWYKYQIGQSDESS